MALGIISRNQVQPGLQCWYDLIRVMCFMYDHRHLKVSLERKVDKPELIGFSDADWAGDLATSKSVGGGIIEWGGMILRVFSKRQTCIARSSTESELYALNKVALAMDCERFVELLQFLGWKSLTSFRIKCDNKSTIALCKKKCGSTKLSRAFRLRNDDLLDMYNEKILEVEHISGTENPADGFTKAWSQLPLSVQRLRSALFAFIF